MSSLFRPLNYKAGLDIKSFGAKAHYLNRVNELSANVPNGYALHVNYFDEFCDFNEIDTSNVDDMESFIIKGIYPHSMRQDLWNIWELLDVESCVVRSSGVEEDAHQASYAGVFKSILNVRNYEMLLEAVKICWASYYSKQAIYYRNRTQGLDEGIAVIIQKMLTPDKSGVLFSGIKYNYMNCTIIEAYPGLGSAIMDAQVNADKFFLYENNRIEKVIGMKKIQYMPGRLSCNIVPESVPLEQQEKSILNNDELARLAVIGENFEKHFKWPCDIEWAKTRDAFYILQVRPVSRENFHSQIQKYSCFDTNIPTKSECSLLDRYSEPASVCYLSLLQMWENKVYLDLYTNKIAGPEEELPLEFYFNRVYWNLKYQRRYFDDIPFGEIKKARTYKLLRLFKTGYRNWYQRLDFYEEALKRFRMQYDSITCLKELDGVLEEVIDYFCGFIGVDHFQFLGLAQISYRHLIKLLDPYCDGKQVIAKLLQRYPVKNMTIQSNKELEKLVNYIKKDSAFRKFFKENDSKEILDQMEEFNPLLGREIKKFLSNHGHRGTSCDDIFTPHWQEAPEAVIDLIKQFLNMNKEESSDEKIAFDLNTFISIEVGVKESEKVFKQIRFFMQMTAEYMALRENQRYYFDKSWTLIRSMLLSMGELYCKSERLLRRDDIFHLTIEEIKKINRGEKYDGCREIAMYRKQIYEKNKHIFPPYLIKNRDIFNIQSGENRKKYKAIGISPGIVVGRVCKVECIGDLNKVQQGDILIVPMFHPSWTPILGKVGGIVMNYGNILSHGAVVAREYGIPVVVFNGVAKQYLSDDSWIEVNGSTGRIRVVS